MEVRDHLREEVVELRVKLGYVRMASASKHCWPVGWKSSPATDTEKPYYCKSPTEKRRDCVASQQRCTARHPSLQLGPVTDPKPYLRPQTSNFRTIL